MPVFLRRSAPHFGHALQEQAPALPPLEADAEDRSAGPGTDGPGLGEDLGFLGVGSDQVEHPVVHRFGVFEEGGEGRDGLSRPGRRIEQQDAPALDQVLDLVDRGFLARTGSIRKERADYGRRVVGGRRVTFTPIEPRRRV